MLLNCSFKASSEEAGVPLETIELAADPGTKIPS